MSNLGVRAAGMLASQLRYGFGDRGDAAERAAAQHGFGELDIEAFFEREHESDGGERGKAGGVEIAFRFKRRNVRAVKMFADDVSLGVAPARLAESTTAKRG
jgi:hypothetical protein